jgi:hypothetical protein
MAVLINDTAALIVYTATAGQTVFSVPFEFFDAEDLVVERAGAVLTYAASPADASQYSVAGANVEGGGSITLGAPGATLADRILIYRNIPIDRQANYPETGPMAIRSLNQEQARQIAIMQQLRDRINEALRGSVGNLPLPVGVLEDGDILGVVGEEIVPLGGTTGQALVKVSDNDLDTTWSTITGYSDEQVRDVMGTALVAGSGITITPSDGADTITIATSGGGGSTNWWFDPPTAASLTLSNTGGTNLALTDDSDAGLLVDMVNMTGTNQTRHATRTLTSPSLDWDFKMRFALSMTSGTDHGFGIVVLGSTGDQISLTVRGNDAALIISRASSGAVNSVIATTGALSKSAPIKWVRAQRVGANISFLVSADGKLWKQFISGSVPASTLSGGPNRVGFTADCNSTSSGYVLSAAIENFDLTGPAV